ncbi:MFS transporter [Alphaproteobacteria bacterium]|nr:MFS transporter [Alphaproteobacteria bacterium]
MWMAASIFYAYQYVLRVIPSVMLDNIMQQFQMDTVIFGQFSGVYYIGYSLMHIPLGILMDKWGPRKIISTCILFSAIGILPIVFAEQWIYPTVGRFITGIGSSAAILGLFKIIRMAFDEQRFTRMLSFSVTIGIFGAIYGGAPVGYMCEIFTHKIVVGILALVGVALAIATYIIIPEIKSETDENNSMFSNLRDVLTNSKVIIICISAGLMVGPLEGFADIWGPKFLTQIYGVENSAARYLTSMLFIGMCVGAPILNFIAEKLKDYLKTVILSGSIMFFVFLMLIADALSIAGITIGFFIVGICSAYQILAIYKASTYVNKNSVNLATAIANMVIMIFGYVFHGAIGTIIKMCDGLGTNSAFCCGIMVIPIALLLGTIGFAVVFRMDRTGRVN